jgi:hypothetical protein
MKKFVRWPLRVGYCAFACQIVAVLVGIPIPLYSHVIHVPQDDHTLMEAVGHATDWDTILVAPGTYEGLFYRADSLSPRFVTLMGSGWPYGTTVVAYVDSPFVFDFEYVCGWRVTNFELTQAGIMIEGDSLEKCEIDHNYMHGARYGYSSNGYWPSPITLYSARGLKIHHNLLVDSDHSGIVLNLFRAPTDRYISVHIYNNTFRQMVYEGIIFKGPGEDPEGCIVTNNVVVECNGQGLEFAFCDQNDTEVSYNCIYQTNGPWQNVNPGPGNIYEDPDFLLEPTIPEYYYLGEESPCVDTGNPESFYNDPDGSRSDMGAFPYGGASNTVRLQIEWASAFPGDTVYVPLSISRVTGLDVTSAELIIHYPTNDLEFLDLTLPNESLPHQAGWGLQYEDMNGSFRSTLSGNNPLVGSGLFATMSFVLDEYASPGVWDIGFTDASLNDGAIEVTTVDGGIAFSAEDLLYGDVNLSGTVTLSDASLLFNYLVGGVELCHLQRILAEVSGLADITSYDGSLIMQYCLGEFPLFPVEGGSMDMSAEGELGIEGGTPEPGHEFRISIEVENGVNVSASQFQMILDGAPVELTDIVIPTGRVWFSRCRGAYPNYEIYLGGREIMNGYQEIATLAFEIPDTASGEFSIRLTNILLNETEVTAEAYENFTILSAEPHELSLPQDFSFEPAYPNPFNAVTQLSFALPRSSEASLRFYNSLGQLVDVVSLGILPAGLHRHAWDASNFPSGLYIAEFVAGGNRATQKLLMVK